MEIKKINKKEIWESFIDQCEEKTFLHSWNWGEFQKMEGEKIWRWGIFENEQLVSVALILGIKAKRGTFLFVPHGPLLRSSSGNSKFEARWTQSGLPGGLHPKQYQKQPYGESGASRHPAKSKILNIFIKELKELAKNEKADFIRVAPVWEKIEENNKIFQDLGFRNAPIHMHPELTWELSLGPSEEELLMKMRKTTRYLIRQAEKNPDIEIIKSQNIEDVEKFNQIYQETVKRHRFVPFSQEYLKNEFSAFVGDNQTLIFLGKYKGEIICSAMVIYYSGGAYYHQGASSHKYERMPASYLMQWEAIKEAKKRGCRTYNFWGIAPLSAIAESGNSKFEIRWTRSRLPVGLHSKQILNPKLKIPKNHPWYGLSLFKMGFGGYKKEYVKTQDLVLSGKYWLTNIFEKIRKLKRRL